MTDRPLVSVIIPAYNAARFVAQAVESVLAQSYRPVEILVIDDGSTDDTARVLEPYRDAIRYIRQPNGGPSRARNNGLAHARGELIAFLDADDVWLPDKLSRQVRCLEESPAVGVVHCDTYNLDEQSGARSRRATPRDDFAGNCYARLFRGNQVTYSTVVIRRECLDRVGPMDERYTHAEDYDLLLRLARRFPFAYVPEPLAVYRLHDTNATRNAWRLVSGELAVLQKTIREDPALKRLLGARLMRERLFGLHFHLGYSAFLQEDLRSARHHFLGAALAGRWKSRPWLLYLASWLPLPLLRRLRSLRRRLTLNAGVEGGTT
jgi:glycosyltransferase involved in cell wall biosynthesis